MKKRFVIDGIEYTSDPHQTPGLQAIVVCDRGFVLYGTVEIKDSYLTISHGCCIRRWGTTAGLGQLAIYGPQSKTILDRQPITLVHELKVVQIIECEGEPWKLP